MNRKEEKEIDADYNTTPTSFEYGGYHFTPVRRFVEGEGDFHSIMRRAYSDSAVPLNTYGTNQGSYSYEGFYAAASDKSCDLFRCTETGRLYFPALNELFCYSRAKAY